MPMRASKTIKGDLGGIFEQIDEPRNIMIDGASLDPLDVGATDKYIIPAGTPLCPVVASGKYKPIRRTKATAAVSNDTALTVANAKPFAVGDAIYFYASLAATATLATVAAVDTSTNVITLSANHTVADAEYVEVKENGAHSAATTANPTQIPDAVILAETVEVYREGATFDVPAVGVIRGVITRANVNGPGTAAFDQLLKSQLPNISFLPVNAGTA